MVKTHSTRPFGVGELHPRVQSIKRSQKGLTRQPLSELRNPLSKALLRGRSKVAHKLRPHKTYPVLRDIFRELDTKDYGLDIGDVLPGYIPKQVRERLKHEVDFRLPEGDDEPFVLLDHDVSWRRYKIPKAGTDTSTQYPVGIPKGYGGFFDKWAFPLANLEPDDDNYTADPQDNKHIVDIENLGPGKKIYDIPKPAEEVVVRDLRLLVLIMILWGYIRYYLDLVAEMIEKDVSVWDYEKIQELENYWRFNMIHADAMEKWQLDFQDPATPVMEGIINLHHDLMFFLLIIASFVLWVLLRTVYLFDRSRGHEPSKVAHGTVLEIVWTIVPSFILLAVAIPSFALLYAIDEASDPAITIKVIGHQWYWVYEYSDYTVDSNTLSFESFMIPEADLKPGQLRLLEVDNRIVVPTNTHIRFLITSADVLHSWAVPSLGVKLDALPGRLNQATVFIKRDGVYYGQCSEICGVNHAFMPIVVESVPLDEYVSWVANQIEA